MELTNEQIQLVENYLDKKSFDFIDLKVEILDHMISDIESFMDKEYSFENAFKITVLKWDKHFKDSSSFFFGLQYHESKIVVKKAAQIFKPFYFLYLTAYFLPIVIFTNFNIVFSKSNTVFLNQLFFATSIISLIYLLYIIINNIRTKIKTTYSYVLKTQYVSTVFLILPLFMGNLFNDDGSFIPFLIGFQSAGFAVTYICHYFYKKHKAAIKKYKIS
ncbi:hypothetical protein H0I29_05885 [Polaribacter sp. R2A056_3_33]|uniref:hypothetical protein n=1 Tax=unclassified Polaribacter TaxID=196858 RepID=UPI001C4EA705|nr:hypothetical protein [Polaribacter sp. R2A056_3_33]QXP71611.1 hypothetical protein H0I29_05885 [Polaribacter sp. R2A056_3_33]